MNSSHPLFETVSATVMRLTGSPPAQIDALAGGASLRRYYRIVTAAQPASLLLMELGELPRSDEVVQNTPIEELPFVNIQRYLEAGKVAVPAIYYYDQAAGLIYLEDLGDVTLEMAVEGASPAETIRHYQAAIDALVGMQAYADRHADSSCVAFSREFDYTLLRWELDHFLEFGLGELGVTPSAAERAAVAKQFDELAQELANAPKHFVHRDFQSRNLMIQALSPKNIRVRIIDFQDALLGSQVYDLVGLLRDSYIDLGGSLEQLLAYYGQKSGAEATFVKLFHLQTVQRKLKDIGRFVFIEDVKKLPGYKKYIPLSLSYVRAALLQLPAFSTLSELLARAKNGS